EFIEEQLATNYAKENIYCFAIDRKASPKFIRRILALKRCFPNVVVTNRRRDLDSAGHNHNKAHLDCMRATRKIRWEYAMLLQNHDVMLKTHKQMTEILRIYGGANDIEITPCPAWRCLPTLERNLGTLGLCPKDLSEEEFVKCNSTELRWGKGSMEGLLSRAAVD
ncbi:hypothetical protein PMAYCL1PPCAC_05221, partial [Pristionchus mayeri]